MEEQLSQMLLVEKELKYCQHRKNEVDHALEQCQNKVSALEELHRAALVTIRMQKLEWDKERQDLLKFLTDSKNTSRSKEDQLQEFEEKLSGAAYAVERLTDSRLELLEEVSKTQLDAQHTHVNLSEVELVALSIRKAQDKEIESLDEVLKADVRGHERAQQELVEHQKTVNAVAVKLARLQEIEEQYAALKEESLIKTEQFEVLSRTQEKLKYNLETAQEAHETDMEAVKSCSLMKRRLGELTSEIQSLQVSLNTVQALKTETELEAERLKEDLVKAQDAQTAYQQVVDQETKGIAALKETVLAEDQTNSELKNQETGIKKEQQECKPRKRKLMQSLEQSLNTVTPGSQITEVQELDWKIEREEMLMALSSTQDSFRSKEDHLKRLQEKLSNAECDVQHMTESRAQLLAEVSKLNLELHHTGQRLIEAEFAMMSMEKEKENQIASLTGLLQAKAEKCEDAQQALEEHRMTINAMSDKITNLEGIEQLYAVLQGECRIKEEQLQALSKSQENVKNCLKAAEDEHCRNIDNLTSQLENALESHTQKDKRLQEQAIEFQRLQAALSRVQDLNTDSEIEVGKLKEMLQKAQEENSALQQSLESNTKNSRTEIDTLGNSLVVKEKEIQSLKQKVESLELYMSQNRGYEKRWLDKQSECDLLSQKLTQIHLDYNELFDIHKKNSLQSSQREDLWHEEKANLLSEIQRTKEKLAGQEVKLQETLSDLNTLKGRCEGLEVHSSSCEDSIRALHLKLDELNEQLCIKNQNLANLQEKLQMSSSALTALLEEKNAALTQMAKAMHELDSELVEKAKENQDYLLQKEILEKEAHNYQDKIKVLEESIVTLKTCLNKKTQEVGSAIEDRIEIEAKLRDTTEKLKSAKMEAELQIQELRETCAVSDLKLQEALTRLKEKDKEKETLLACLETRDGALNDLKQEKNALLQGQNSFKEAMLALQEKTEMLLLEAENDRSTMTQLCNNLEEKEMNLALRSQEVKELQQMLENSGKTDKELYHYKQNSEKLEKDFAEITALLHDKEDELCASEWAVQQLANEVAKAKNAVALKEKEEVLLRDKLSDVETYLKVKERELQEMDSYLQSLVKRHTLKQSEVQNFSQALEKLESQKSNWKKEQHELTSQIGELGRRLEDKTAELSLSQKQLGQRLEREKAMEAAIQNLESKLAEEARVSLERQSESKMFIEELEETLHFRESSLVGQLKDAETKVEQLEQSFQSKVRKLQEKLLEKQEELKSSSSRQLAVENQMEAALTDATSQKKKCCSLIETIALKETSLANLLAELDNLRRDVAEQTMQVEQKSTELMTAREELHYHIEKEKELHENVLFLNTQMHEKEKEEQKTLAAVSHDNEATKAELKCVLQVVKGLNFKLEECYQKEKDTEDKIDKLVVALKDMISQLQEEETEALQSVAITGKLHQKINASLENSIHENAQTIPSSMFSDMLHGTKMLALETMVKILQSEHQRRRYRAEIIFKEIRYALSEYATKEREIQELMAEVDIFRNREEEGVKWTSELWRSQLELEEEIMAVLSFNYPSAEEYSISQWKKDCADFYGQVKAASDEMAQLNDCWKFMVEAFETNKLSINELMVALKEDLQSMSLTLTKDKHLVVNHSDLPKALQAELSILKKIITSTIAEAGEIAEITIAQLRADLKEKTEKEDNSRELIHSLKLQLEDSHIELNKERAKQQHLSTLLTDLQVELGNQKKKTAEACEDKSNLSSKLASASQAYEEMRRTIAATEEEKHTLQAELDRWRTTAEIAREGKDILSTRLETVLQNVAELKRQSESTDEEQKGLRVKVQEWETAAEAAIKDACILRSALEKADKNIDGLRSQLHINEKQSECLRTELEDWKTKAEAAAEELRRKIGGFQQEKRCLQEDLENWKERAESAFEESTTLQSAIKETAQNICEAQSRIDRLEDEKQSLQQDLHEWKVRADSTCEDLNILRSELGCSEQAINELTRNLREAEETKQRLQDSGQTREANLQSVEKRCGQRKKMIESILTKLESSQAGRSGIEARLQAFYNNLLDGEKASHNVGAATQNSECNLLNAVKVPSPPAFQNRLESQPDCTEGVDITENCKDSPQFIDANEYHHYLELCDSLIRRNVSLERQMEKLRRKLQKQTDDDEDGQSKKRRSADAEERRVLQPLPCQDVSKRRRRAGENRSP